VDLSLAPALVGLLSGACSLKVFVISRQLTVVQEFLHPWLDGTTLYSFVRLITKGYNWRTDCTWADGGCRMALAKITRQGLVFDRDSGCDSSGAASFRETLYIRTAKADTYRALRQIRYLQFKQRIEPVSRPYRCAHCEPSPDRGISK